MRRGRGSEESGSGKRLFRGKNRSMLEGWGDGPPPSDELEALSGGMSVLGWHRREGTLSPDLRVDFQWLLTTSQGTRGRGVPEAGGLAVFPTTLVMPG